MPLRLSVRSKLVLSTLVLLVVVSFAFTAASLYFSEHLAEDDLRRRAIAFSREVAATVGDRRELEDRQGLQIQIRRIIEARPNIRNVDFLALPDPEGWPRVLASSDLNWRSPLTPDELQDLRRGRVIARLVVEPRRRRWETIAPIVRQGSVVGAVAADFSLAPADEQRAQIRATSLAITGASVLVAVLLVGLLVRRVVHTPIHQLLQVIGRVERGDRDARAPVTRQDEFATLAAHLNRMLEELGRASEAQEQWVRQATAELADRYAEVRRLNDLLFQAQHRLRHAERLAVLGRTMGTVAHEVGTPLHSIAGHLELLRQELAPDVLAGSPARRLAIIDSQLARVTETIEQLLAASRRPAGARIPVDVNASLREVLDLVSPGIAGGRVEVRTELGPVPPVSADAAQLQHALLNVVTNALDAMAAGGVLGIRTGVERRDGQPWALVRVSDTGGGIAPEHLKRIFEPFFTTKELGKGVGLGLFITQQIVRDHGGDIDVETGAERGTTFSIALPGVGATA